MKIEKTVGSALEISGLSRSFGAVIALDQFTISIQPGELIALLGPSGCGKTTALRIVAGLEKADRGSVHINGEDLLSKPANNRDIGMVFQSYSLFPNMTVAENISYGLRVRRMKSDLIKKRVIDMLDLVELPHKINSYPHQLSGGQQQRVALARALAIEPRVLLLDEPLSALDAQVRSQIRDEIRRIQIESGTTTLFVTHDQEEAMAIADRVGVMQHGRLEQLDTPNNLYNKPATPFVASFVGITNSIPAVAESSTQVVILNQSIDIAEHSVAINAGDHVSALVRPEWVSLEKSAGVSLEKSAGESRVITKSFLGPMTRIGVHVGLKELVYAERSSKEARNYDTGDLVKVSIATDSVMVENV